MVSLAIGLVGILLSVFAAWQLRQSNQGYIDATVTREANLAANAISERFKLYQYGLQGAKGVILTAGEDGLTRKQFVQYSEVRDIDREFPGARGFGFIRRVPIQDEAAFLAQARADDFPEFSIRQLNANDLERYVIQYIEPADRNMQAIGLDIGSETNRRTAADDAMKTGLVQLTGPITLVQATGNPQQSFLILSPIYRPGMPLDSAQDRINAAYGWSYAPLLMEEVLSDLDIYDGTFSLVLDDITTPESPVTFFRNLPAENFNQLAFTDERQFGMFGRIWSMDFAVTPEFIKRLNLFPPEVVLGTGATASIGLAMLFAAFASSRRNKQNAMKDRAVLASIVESSFDGIVGCNLDGVITSWNPAATELFGFDKSEALGQVFEDLLVPAALRREEQGIQDRLSKGLPTENFETQRLRKDGTMIDLSVTASPIKSDVGEIIGSSQTMRDFTAQKEARQRINEINAELENLVAERTEELTNVNSLLINILRAATDVSIIATDENGEITVFNSGAEKLFGFSQAEAVGKIHLNELFLTTELEAYAAEISAQNNVKLSAEQALFYWPIKGETTTRDWTQRQKDGGEFIASTVISELKGELGEHNGLVFVAIDVTQKYKIRRQLEAARNQLQMAADVAEMGVWSWETGSNRLRWNANMFHIYEYPLSLDEEGVTFDHWASRVSPDDIDRLQQRLAGLLDGTGDFDTTFSIITPGGETKVIQTGADVERNDAGDPIRVTGFNRDITDQTRREELLQHAKESADRASAAKSNFLANMSHEIRTPMNAILGMLQLTRQTDLSPLQTDYLSKAQSSAKSLLRILNDILDYSKIEAGKLELDIHSFDLFELLEELGNILFGNEVNDGIDLVFDISPDLPGKIKSDSLKLQQVLTNLASNALKFTHNGYVRISVKPVAPRTSEVAKIRFAVEDTGIGISDEQLSRLFTGFTQAEASTSRQFGGTGLGLAISDSFIAALGGKIEVTSTPGKGSTFSFELAFDVVENTASGVIDDSVPANAEANSDQDQVLFLTLADHAADVYQGFAPNGGNPFVMRRSIDALLGALVTRKSAATAPVRLVIDEYGFTDADAQDLATKLEAIGPDKLQIICLTRRESKLINASSSLEIHNLPKPFLRHHLYSALKQFSAAERKPASAQSDEHGRLAGLNILVVEDNTLNREVARGLLQNEGAIVDLAVNGKEGVDKALSPDQSYDFVIMDVQMPGMDGMEATREIRKVKSDQDLPIIAMTANASPADRDKCLAAGMNDHLGKPINLDEFVTVIMNHAKAQQQPTDEPA